MSSTSARQQGDYTFEDFLELVPDGMKADLLDGVIYMASPDNTEASDLLTWLAFVIVGFVTERDLGRIYLLRVAYRITSKRGPEPDLGFVPKRLEATRRRGYIDGPPAFAIEIVSPDSVARDYIEKRTTYEQAGVQEYWILDPDDQRVTFLRLHGGRYHEVKPVANIIESEAIPGLALDVRWLLSDDRPRPYEVLQGLLSQPRRGRKSARKPRRRDKPS